MGLESKYFKHDFYYDNARVERFIEIIKSPDSSPQRQQAFKNVVFKMMKDVVKKNMRNYLNLLTNGTSIEKGEIRMSNGDYARHIDVLGKTGGLEYAEKYFNSVLGLENC